jgi:hypothetical protein
MNHPSIPETSSDVTSKAHEFLALCRTVVFYRSAGSTARAPFSAGHRPCTRSRGTLLTACAASRDGDQDGGGDDARDDARDDAIYKGRILTSYLPANSGKSLVHRGADAVLAITALVASDIHADLCIERLPLVVRNPSLGMILREVAGSAPEAGVLVGGGAAHWGTDGIGEGASPSDGRIRHVRSAMTLYNCRAT